MSSFSTFHFIFIRFTVLVVCGFCRCNKWLLSLVSDLFKSFKHRWKVTFDGSAPWKKNRKHETFNTFVLNKILLNGVFRLNPVWVTILVCVSNLHIPTLHSAVPHHTFFSPLDSIEYLRPKIIDRVAHHRIIYHDNIRQPSSRMLFWPEMILM